MPFSTQRSLQTALALALTLTLLNASVCLCAQDILSGLVIDHKGKPVASATVTAISDEPVKQQPVVSTNVEGRFEFPIAPNVPTTLVAAAREFGPQSKRIETYVNQGPVTLRLLPGRRIRLRLVNEQGQPVEGVRVKAIAWQKNEDVRIEGGLKMEVETDSAGRCLFRSAPSAPVTYAFEHGKYEAPPTQIKPAVGEQTIKLTKKSFRGVLKQLDREANDLSSSFSQSLLGAEWIKREQIRFQQSPSGAGQPSNNGFVVHQQQTSQWNQSELQLNSTVIGDFDVEAEYEIQSFDGVGGSAILDVLFADSEKRKSRAVRKVMPSHTIVSSQRQWNTPEGVQHQYETKRDPNRSGTLRVARRGDRIFTLFRNQSDEPFQILESYAWSDAATVKQGIRLTVAAPAKGEIQAMWKAIRVRADRIIDHTKGDNSLGQIAVYDVETQTTKRICVANNGYRNVGSPRWSPDGKWIAYDQSNGSTRDMRIMVVNAQGGEPVDIGFGSMPTFSPDGNQIAFSALGEGLGVVNRDGGNRKIIKGSGWSVQWSPGGRLSYSAGGQFYRMDRDGNNTQAVLMGDASNRYSYLYWNHCWSPDGQKIAFKGRRNSDGNAEIAIVDLDRPERVTVILPEMEENQIGFSWSKDGNSLFFTRKAASGQREIAEVASDGSGEPQRYSSAMEFSAPNALSWSPDRKRLAISGINRPSESQRIFRLDADGKNLRKVTRSSMGFFDHKSPAVSPDGTALAFVLYKGNPRTSRLMYLKGHEVSVRDLGLGCVPHFSRDGNTIAYSSFSGRKLLSVHSNATQTVAQSGLWSIKPSPIDERLAAARTSTNPGANLVILSNIQDEGKELLQGIHASRYSKVPYFYAWSPDGKEIALIGHRSSTNTRELVLVSTQGSNHGFKVLCDASDIDDDISWHPNGTHLAIARREPKTGFQQLYLLPLDDPTSLTPIPGQPFDANNSEPVYTQDGSFIYFSSKPVTR